MASGIGNLSTLIQLIPKFKSMTLPSKVQVAGWLLACIGFVALAGGDSFMGARLSLIVLASMAVGSVQATWVLGIPP